MWLTNFFKSLTSPRRRSKCRLPSSTRLCLEPLEDRCLLSYSIIDLGTLGGAVSTATDINASAQVVGYSATADGTRAFLWQNGVMINLGTLGGTFSEARAINDTGQVVGRSYTSSGALRAFLLTPEDTNNDGTPDRWFRDTNADGKNDLMRDLGTLGGTNATSEAYSEAYDVNNLGQVVGYAWTGSQSRAFLWDNGAMSDLGTLGGSYCVARAINDAGQITGWSNTASGSAHTFLRTNGVMIDLGESDGASDINQAGLLVDSRYSFGRLWTPTEPNGTTGTFTDLGYLPPPDPLSYGADSIPFGMNNVGQVVGKSDVVHLDSGDTGGPRGFVWAGGVMEELPLDSATAINDAGQIVGNRPSSAYLLTPVPPGTPHVSISGGAVTEGNSGTTNLNFTASLSVPSTDVVTVHYATVDGTATAGSDYVAASGTLSFAPGQTSQTISVTVFGDRIPEVPLPAGTYEAFSVVLSNATGAFIENGSAGGAILDDEPRIYGCGATVVEGNAGSSTAVVRILLLTGAYDQPVTVDYATADGYPSNYGIATADSDYVSTSGSLTFAPGQTMCEVPVTILSDRTPELLGSINIETLSVVLSNPSAIASVGGNGAVFIQDDEPIVSVNSFVSVTEGDAPSAVFTVNLSTPYDQDVTVSYSTSDACDPYFQPNVAEAGSDYIATSGSLVFAAGQTSKTVAVPIIDDQLAEWTEYFFFDLGNAGSNASIDGWNSQGVAQIIDHEPPALTVSDASRQEGNTSTTACTFTVSLSYSSTQNVTVNYATANGSALAGSDYQAASGTLTFAPGETSKFVTVQVNGDRTGEANETFLVVLSNPTNATIADGSGEGTIIDDEPRVSINDVSKKEGNGNGNTTTVFTFTVTLSVAYDVPITLSFATADGTAKTSDNDYVASSGTVTFAPGETSKTITVVVKGDRKKEANENFFVDLSDLSGYAVFLDSRGMGMILNDD
jgi:probable HAF family extracellular repeat protein